MNSFSSKNRQDLIKRISTSSFDLLVIGGGITGAGIALDASARGLKVVLLDMQDFAAGTSSRSTKLIHGGLRYLKQLELGLVAEVGKERAIIHRIAPHLSRPEPMLLPITKNGSFTRFTTRLAMLVYEWLAGVKKAERHQMMSKQQAAEKEPLLEKENLLGAVLYYEYRTDDARLTIEVLKEAASRGALVLSYAKVNQFMYQDGRISGVVVKDQLRDTSFELQANHIINAAGPWVDELDSLDDQKNGSKLQITKGVHIVVDRKKLPVKQSLYIDTQDKRMIFIIPREGKIYIGTTDTFYTGDKCDPKLTEEDKSYLLKCMNDYFPHHSLGLSDIESSWVGLRPLIKKVGKKPSEISRKDEVFTWDSGLISIAGGKLTGYRKMAKRVVDIVSQQIAAHEHRKIQPCTTDRIEVSGGKLYKSVSFKAFVSNKMKEAMNEGITGPEAEKLILRYGSNVDELFSIIRQLKREPSDDHLPLSIRAQIIYGIEHEMCVTPSDFFIRRTGMLYFDIAEVKSIKFAVLKYMQSLMFWNSDETDRYEVELERAISQAQ